MLNISAIFALTISVLLLVKSLDFIYLFQIKEYRLDRFWSFLKEEGLFKIFYFRKIRLPAKKPRNIVIVFIVLIFSIFYYLYLFSASLQTLIFFLVILPLTSFCIVFANVILTQIPVYLYRRVRINQAAKMVKKSKAVFIGITGSYGKTTTKEFLYQILSSKYKVAKTIANMNTEIGIALSIIKNLKPETEIFIAEIGAYRIGEIKNACKIITPKMGILTGVGNQHLDLFGSYSNLLKAKSELLQALPKEGIAYINKDIPDYQKFAVGLACKAVTYSTKSKADIYLQSVKAHLNLLQATVNLHGQQFEINTNLLGTHNLQLLLPCIVLASHLQIAIPQIISAIKNLQPVTGKLSLHKGLKDATIIRDDNNSNVEGFIEAIETADKFPQEQKIIISRGIIELGSTKIKSYKKILQALCQSTCVLYTTDKLFKLSDTKNKVLFFKNEDKLLETLKNKVNEKTLIVVEGRFPSKFIKTIAVS